MGLSPRCKTRGRGLHLRANGEADEVYLVGPRTKEEMFVALPHRDADARRR